MQIIILYAGVENREQDWPDNHSLALQRIAGSNVLGHVLNQLYETQAHKVTLIVEKDAEAVSAWAAQDLPGLDLNIIEIAPGATPLAALAACREWFDRKPLLVVLGSHIVEADYKDLDQNKAGMMLFTRQQAAASASDYPDDAFTWAGVCHFRHGSALRAALDVALPAGQLSLASLLNDLRNSDLAVEMRPVTLSLDTGTIEGLLYANARLLGLGYGSEDAIERSYVEDFTVIPPVFLHQTAAIENAVIGPFANVEAGARISGSVIRNSLIGQDSDVENAILDGSIIGSRATVKASGAALIVEEGTEIIL